MQKCKKREKDLEAAKESGMEHEIVLGLFYVWCMEQDVVI